MLNSTHSLTFVFQCFDAGSEYVVANLWISSSRQML